MVIAPVVLQHGHQGCLEARWHRAWHLACVNLCLLGWDLVLLRELASSCCLNLSIPHDTVCACPAWVLAIIKLVEIDIVMLQIASKYRFRSSALIETTSTYWVIVIGSYRL